VPASELNIIVPTNFKLERARYYSRPCALIYGVSLLVIAFLCFMGFAWFTTKLLLTLDSSHGYPAIGLLLGFVLARLLAFLYNRHLKCNLCHGTVLDENRCQKHAKATRLPGLSYPAATVIKVICTGGFRCMYCGTLYRLKK
jgi:hypothetical protein